MNSELEKLTSEFRPEDFLVRAALHPRITENATGRPSPMKMLAPTDIGGKNRSRTWGWSVAYRAMLPTIDQVHEYGCRVAAKSNADKQRRFMEKGKSFERPRDTVHYVGSHDIRITEVAEITTPYYEVSVEAFATRGLDEHCRIRLDVKDAEAQTEDELAIDRTEIIWQLFDLLQCFSPKICECDLNDLAELLTAVQHELMKGEEEPEPQTPDLV